MTAAVVLVLLLVLLLLLFLVPGFLVVIVVVVFVGVAHEVGVCKDPKGSRAVLEGLGFGQKTGFFLWGAMLPRRCLRFV